MRAVSPVFVAFASCLCSCVAAFSTLPRHSFAPRKLVRSTNTELYGFRDFLKKTFSRSNNEKPDEQEDELKITEVAPPEIATTKRLERKEMELADVCIIGGGVSGLTAAITAAQELQNATAKIVLLEASPTLGGRVQTDMKDGFTLDRGFAVYIEDYPVVKELNEMGILNNTALNLGRFLPGSLVKLQGRNELARVVDPIRSPEEIFNALLAPVGTLGDKLNVFKLVIFAFTKSVKELFEEPETDTLSFLESYGFEEDFIDKFFKPFLEGIYLAPLNEQSSRMFYFIWKMFSEGAASLPEGGIGAVGQQLADKANETGIDLRCQQPAGNIHEENGMFCVDSGKKRIKTKSLVLATDGQVAHKLMAKVEGFQSLETLPETPQREVACIYYSFNTTLPVTDPMLVLSGRGELRGTKEHPINNVCFPSAVNKAYAPEGSNLCSVTVLEPAIDQYRGQAKELEKAVREELGTWFPERAVDIKEKWELKGFYYIPNAQPAQFGGPFPANVNGGRDCTMYRGKKLPEGLVVCGDHMATATLNGALESGLNAGKVAAKNSKRVVVTQ